MRILRKFAEYSSAYPDEWPVRTLTELSKKEGKILVEMYFSFNV